MRSTNPTLSKAAALVVTAALALGACGGGGDGGGSEAAFCSKLKTVNEKMANMSKEVNSADYADEWRQIAADFGDLAANAPDAIKNDIATVKEAVQPLANGDDSGLNSSVASDAGDRVASWAASNCK